MKYETVVGLETHAQLSTESKMFCGCSTKFGAEPNTHICPVCTGQPGSLPVVNKKAFELAIKTAIALNCTIEPKSVFARKNYFYPDLPKGYQVSQYELPLATKGSLEIEVDGKIRKIGITRVHLEEDAGKLNHQGSDRIMGSEGSLVDYNRTGTPLMEIVSEPDIRSPKEAAVYMETLASLLRYIGVCDAKMEEGSLRCDANLSIRPMGETKLGTRTELKNMNSFKAVEKALICEEARHQEVLEDKKQVIQETRFYDETVNATKGMRSKEDAHDYRYFPEPDLVPVEPSKDWVKEIRQSLGELPEERKKRFAQELGLPTDTIIILLSDKPLADFLEKALEKLSKDKAKVAANWLVGDILAFLHEKKKSIKEISFKPEQLVELVELVDKGTISGKIAKTILVKALESGQPIKDIVAQSGMTQISNEDEIKKIVTDVIASNEKPVLEYKAGKKTAIGFLVGQVMKASKGRANPGLANKLLKEKLDA